MAATTYPNYSPGLEGVIAGITRICEIDKEHSRLIYRGYDAHDIAEMGSFEETAYLLFYGELPNAAKLAEFKATLAKEREVPGAIYDVLRLIPKNAHPMDTVKAAYAALAPLDPDYEASPLDHDANVRKAVRITAKAATIVTNAHRIRNGQPIVAPDPSLGTAGNFLYMLNAAKPDSFTEKVLDTSLTLYAEHGFNASTFACRVTVATLSDIYSGIVSGIGTLRGSLHGGANEEAMKMLLEIGSADKARDWVIDALATKKKIMGFGHREYKKGDSRVPILKKLAREIGERKGDMRWVETAEIVEKTMMEEKGIIPNVDFPAAYAYYQLGIPIELYTPIFVVARVTGWSSHAIEQLDNNRLIRPQCIYEGPGLRPWIPIDKR
jgi:2-methylcitrate synthase/citrate synthase II